MGALFLRICYRRLLAGIVSVFVPEYPADVLVDVLIFKAGHEQ